MNYPYLVAGISIVNDLRFPDGSRQDKVLGGCCVFALCGIGSFTAGVLPVTSGGPDFPLLYGSYFQQNGVSDAGARLSMPATHHTELFYEPDGRWSERSLWGEDYFAVQKQNNMTTADQLLPFLGAHSRGLYLDALADDGIFQELDKVRTAAPNVRILWEPPTISSKSETASIRQAVSRNLSLCDAFSMNLDEASFFFETTDREQLLTRIRAVGRPCFLRMGEQGAAWVEEQGLCSLPALLSPLGIDPTGCGNCSSGAALYGWCEGKSPIQIVALANAAASLCARQRGPSPFRKQREQGLALALANQLLAANGHAPLA